MMELHNNELHPNKAVFEREVDGQTDKDRDRG